MQVQSLLSWGPELLLHPANSLVPSHIQFDQGGSLTAV